MNSNDDFSLRLLFTTDIRCSVDATLRLTGSVTVLKEMKLMFQPIPEF